MILILDKEKILENKTMFNDNIEINYPFFGIEEIDSYINNYLNDSIDKESEVLIDYDYSNEENNYYITFYKHIFKNNIIKNNIDSFLVNTKDNTVSKINPLTYEYDIIYNKVVDKGKKQIALTFDDGPNYNTYKVLEVLKEYNVQATFFVLGSKINKNATILQKIVDNGHEIGNHTYNHKILTRLKDDEILKEIEDTNKQIFDVTGIYSKLLRPSYGIVNNTVKKISDYPIIIWDIDTLDWKYHNSKKIAKRVMDKAEDGDIILMHDVYTSTANALKIIIPELQKNGYTFVTVSELFYYKEIELEKGKVYGYA